MTPATTCDPFLSERDPAPAAQRRSDGTWTCVRRDYLDGASAPQLAERYGVSVSAIRARARAEGWRRTDAPDPSPAPDPQDEADDLAAAAAASPAELRVVAWARAAAAVRRGRLQEALGWTRLVRQLDAMAERAAAASPAVKARVADSLARAADTLAALRSARWGKAGMHDLHEMHDLHAPSKPIASTPSADPCACGDPDVSAPTKAVADQPDLGLRMRGDEREGEPLHDLHELHGPFPPCEAVAAKGAGDPPGRDRLSVDAPSAALTADTSPAPLAQETEEEPPPYRPPTGPILPLHPPDWVRHALGAR